MRIRGLDHIAVAVRDLEASRDRWQALFLLEASPVEVLNERGVKVVRLKPEAGPAVELVAPLGADSPVSGFLRERGEGIHHLCFEVEDIRAALEELKAQGVQLLQERPVRGAEGSLIAFIHPRSCGGVLLELKQKGRVRLKDDGR